MDKRAGERVPILGAMPGEIMVFQPMLVTEIGRKGATVETRFPLQLDSLHDLRLALGDHSVIVKGRVVHSHISDVDQDLIRYSSGFEFVDVPARVAAAIDGFLTRLQEIRNGV